MRRLAWLVVLAAVAAGIWLLLPPAPLALGALPASTPAPVRGVIHVHTARSDGGGTVDAVARAAAGAGLQFVIVTDHGDATRAPDPPSYRSGVLCIDAVEVSTENGHLVALGVPQAPYPLGGEARDVIEDVGRLGGFAIAAHPMSSKPALRWTEWTAPFGGIEWLNGDSEWRDETPWELTRALLTYPFRRAETLGRLLDRSDVTMSRWDALTARRRVVAVAASDAHARVAIRDQNDPPRTRFQLPLPGYGPVFGAFSIAIPDLRLTGRAEEDGAAVLMAIRHGHVYSAIDALAAPAALSFTAASGRFTAAGGDVLPLDGEVQLRVETHAPAGARLALFKDGQAVADAPGPRLEHTAAAQPGVYRVEVRVPGAPGQPVVPWIVSNPIYVGRSEVEPPPAPRAKASASVPAERNLSRWTIEHNATSQGALDAMRAPGGGEDALFRYALSGPLSAGPYAAVAVPVPGGLAAYDRLTARLRADGPLRLSVQLRVPGAANGERWQRAVYVDDTAREISVFFDDMRPRGTTATYQPPLDRVASVLFVVDTAHTKSGTNGQVVIEDLRFEK